MAEAEAEAEADSSAIPLAKSRASDGERGGESAVCGAEGKEARARAWVGGRNKSCSGTPGREGPL